MLFWNHRKYFLNCVIDICVDNTTDVVQKRIYVMWLFYGKRVRQWRNDTRCMYSKSRLFLPVLILNIDFLEYEIVRYEGNFTVAV